MHPQYKNTDLLLELLAIHVSFCLNSNVEHYSDYETSIPKDTSSQREVFRRHFFERDIVDRNLTFETLDQGVWIIVVNCSSECLQLASVYILIVGELFRENRLTVQVHCVEKSRVSVHVNQQNVCWHLLVVEDCNYITHSDILLGSLEETD